jgi:CDP-2,3-bis-(O-geranylgeranyl)-sn-glycerol synthase
MDFSVILRVIWFILPAYVANSVAIDVSAVPFLKKYTAPVDFGRTFREKRILGDGKTWRGLVSAVIAGTITGWLQGHYSPAFAAGITQSATLGFLLGLGAMVGDMAASFLKRQSGMERGAMAPILDQLDYIIMAFIFASPVVGFDFRFLLLACAITVPIHVIANFVAYAIKLKKVPW